jgi:hypothetical protein
LTAPGDEGQEGEVPGALDRDGERALTLRGELRLAARLDLAALREEAAQPGDIFVVNLVNAVRLEDVHPAAATAATTAAATEAAPTTTKTTATAAATAASVIRAGGAIVTVPTTARCGSLRALLINHESFLLQ